MTTMQTYMTSPERRRNLEGDLARYVKHAHRRIEDAREELALAEACLMDGRYLAAGRHLEDTRQPVSSALDSTTAAALAAENLRTFPGVSS